MVQKIFKFLFVIGVIIILILSFVLPANPYKLVSSISTITFDRPLWLNIFLIVTFIYSIILIVIYDKIKS